MAITITNDLLTSNNPAYNDSIIEFETTATGTTTANITLTNSGNVFTIYGINNKYFFNFKEIVSRLINQNNYNDTIIPNVITNHIYEDETLSLTLPVTISINDFSGETISKTYTFSKNVEQLISYNTKVNSSNDIKLLIPTRNNIDYYLPYFEGYPFDFSIYGLNTDDSFYLKNISTISTSTPVSISNNNVIRFFLSDGANNETTTSIIALSSTLNKVELYVNNVFKSNLLIKKNESKCGIYLKWFNEAGAYSYWLFDEISETIKADTIDEINTNFDNLQNIKGTTQITGKRGENTKVLTTKFNEVERNYIKSILTSPKVDIYIHNEPFIQIDTYSFIGIKINDSSTTFNKKNNNYKMNITITLPSINTQTL